jgi:toxin ParE1/3/4
VKFGISIRAEAESDISEAYTWYERQWKGLGSDFILCVEEGLAKIQRDPQIYPAVHRNVRRMLIHRFPYGIFYILEVDVILILAVYHAKRNPKQWQARI